jgi:hypothetical protein
MERRPFRMSVIRPDGTLRSSASRFALSARAFGSRFRRLPGCAGVGMLLSSMVVNDLNVVGVAVPERETEKQMRQRAFTVVAYWPARSPLSCEAQHSHPPWRSREERPCSHREHDVTPRVRHELPRADDLSKLRWMPKLALPASTWA